MNIIHCPNCEKELPEDAHYCTDCGNSLTPSEQENIYADDSQLDEDTIVTEKRKRIITAKLVENTAAMQAIPGHFVPDYNDEEATALLMPSSQRGYSSNVKELSRHLNYRFKSTGSVLEKEKDQPLTWQKEVEQSQPRPAITNIPPRPTPTGTVIVKKKRKKKRFNFSLAMWTSLAIIVALILSGLIGIFVTIGRAPKVSAQITKPSLQITPEIATIGDTITI